jgi:hypothetical protein
MYHIKYSCVLTTTYIILPYSIPVLPYGMFSDRFTVTLYICHYEQSPAYVVNDNAVDWTTEESWLFPGGSRASRPAVGPLQPSIQWVTEAHPQG